MIDTERKNTSGSDEASPAIYGIKVFWAKSGENQGKVEFGDFQAFIYCTKGSKLPMVQEVGLINTTAIIATTIQEVSTTTIPPTQYAYYDHLTNSYPLARHVRQIRFVSTGSVPFTSSGC